MIYLLISVPIIGAIVIWLQLFGIKMIAERKALSELDDILFNSKKLSKMHVLNKVHSITNKRLTDNQAIDYFLKIKGLQIMNLSDPMSYWTRKYLLSTTKIRLNYFEQVKFYEAFLNFPATDERANNEVYNTSYSNVILTNAALELIKTKNVAQSMA